MPKKYTFVLIVLLFSFGAKGQVNTLAAGISLSAGYTFPKTNIQQHVITTRAIRVFSFKPFTLHDEIAANRQPRKNLQEASMMVSLLKEKNKTICFGSRWRLICKVKKGKLLLLPFLQK